MSATWTSPDRHRPAAHRRAINAATEATEDVDRLLANHGAALHDALDLMATWADTGLRATLAGGAATDPPIWCTRHHRDRRHCDTPELCPGQPYQPGRDPVGELATDRSDQAAADRRLLLRLLHDRAVKDRKIAEIAQRYTRRRGVATTGGAGIDPDWCSSCQRDGGYCEPIGRLPDGTPRRRGKLGGWLCRWCEGFLAAHGVEPPLEILRMRHAGKRITQADIAAALPKNGRKRTARR